MTKNHAERAHSKFSASGAERWFNCPGSVELSEGLPDKANVWSLEGTEAHEVLEKVLLAMIQGTEPDRRFLGGVAVPADMSRHAFAAAGFMYGLHQRTPESEILVETRVYLDFIHPEAFGTFDGAVVDYFGTLHVFDYKYGMGPVSPKNNLQMIFYAIGLAHRFQWNFKRVRMWIIQPRIRGYDGPVFWEIGILELRAWVKAFRLAIERVEKHARLNEGPWCHWCKAKGICPVKAETKIQQAQLVFGVKR